jgi:hypothetical protein
LFVLKSKKDKENVEFSKIIRKMVGLISIEKGPSNSTLILLDDLDKFL